MFLIKKLIMHKPAIVFGALLILTDFLWGSAAFTDRISDKVTAWLGVVLMVCGFISANKSYRETAMYIAVSFGLYGIIDSAPAFSNGKITGDISPVWIREIVTFILCLIFCGLCIISFIRARNDRELETQTEVTPLENSRTDEE